MKLTDTDYDTQLYLNAIWRRRYIFLISIFFTPLLAVFSTFLLPQKYKANTSIVININALPAMKDISTPVDMSDQFQALKTYISASSSLQKIAIDSGVVKSNAKESEIKGAADKISKGLTIELLDKNVIQIQLLQNTPKHLVDVLNSISNLLIKRLNSQVSNTSQASLNLLANALKTQKQKLDQSLAELNKYETSHGDLLPEFSEIYQNQLRQINNELVVKQTGYTAIKAEKQELEQSLLKINPIITQIDKAILDNDIKLSKLRLVYTENYPGIKALLQLDLSLKSERESLQKKYQGLNKDKMQQLWISTMSTAGSGKGDSQLLNTQLGKLLDMQLKFKGLEQEITTLSEQQKNIGKKLHAITDNKQKLIELKQTIKYNQTAYEDLLTRNNLAKMAVGLNKDEQSSLAKVVAYPANPTSSLSRPISFIFFLGLIAGIFFGISIPIVLELIDTMARNKRAIEAATGFEVICRIECMEVQ